MLVSQAHFDRAMARVPRSVTRKQEAKYLRLKNKMSLSRLGIQADDGAAGDGGTGAAAAAASVPRDASSCASAAPR